MSDYDQRLVNAAGFVDHDLVLPSHDASPVYTDGYAQVIRALEGDPNALAAVRAAAASSGDGNDDS